jgi:hypothetical protein
VPVVRGLCGPSWAALAAALALAGCGDNPTTSARVIADASAKTTAAGPLHATQTVSGWVDGRSLGEGSMGGTFDAARRRATMTYDLSLLAKTSKDVPADFLKGAAVFDGELAYFRIAGLEPLLDPPKRWVKLTRAQIEAEGGPSTAGVGTLDPVRPVDHLRAATGDAEDLGTETIGGTRTKHYRAKIDFRNYVPLAPPSYRPGLARAVEKLDATFGTTKFPVNVWIAEDGTIRRFGIAIRTLRLRLEAVLDVTSIGGRSTIRVPSPRTVLDYDSL